MASLDAAARTRFSGSLRDMGLADLIQTLALNPKGGVIRLRTDLGEGEVWIADGHLVDASLGGSPDDAMAGEPLRGEEALYRLLMATRGTFALEMGRRQTEPGPMSLHPQHAIMEGLRRLDEWSALTPGLPPPASILAVDERHVRAWEDDLTAEERALLEHFDGEQPLVNLATLEGAGQRAFLRGVAACVSKGLLRPIDQLESASSTTLGAVGIHGFWALAYANHLRPPRHPLRTPAEILACVTLLAGGVAAAALPSWRLGLGTLFITWGVLWLATAAERERSRSLGPKAILLAPLLTLIRLAEALGIHVPFARRARAAMALAGS